ncbi:hypothetical protein HFO97_01485 [Rhizobium leguminosarum]|uniref:hypothetical protein n=1 Tax=Rhizobium leguminosarum TaxID=384 RepID=UPI001C9513DE|nr:hypothetical protein [Rhizobium leguminosarum]MBY5358681.1 hypothetical protein [Rhizobium leguminosarum]
MQGPRGDVTCLRRAFDERIWAAVRVLRALGDNLAVDASITSSPMPLRRGKMLSQSKP